MEELLAILGSAPSQVILGWLVIAAMLCGCRTSSKNSAADSTPAIEAQSKWPYDREMITAIQRRWHNLLESRRTPRGKVVVEFNLRANGTVGDIKVVEHTVGELFVVICQKAIADVAPFQSWPQEMKDELKSDVRAVRFNFYYN